MVSRPHLPLPMRRALRQEAHFGCAICGCPILEMHHIIPWRIVLEHKKENIIALCPTCANRADQGEFSDNQLKDMKKNPHNKTLIKDAFNIHSEDISVSLGGCTFINIPRILVIDGFDIISISEENHFPLFSMNFFDKFDRWIALVYENLWFVDRTHIWDLEYKPRHLILRCKPRNISLEIRLEEDVITLKGELFFNTNKVKMTDSELILGTERVGTFFGGEVEGSGLSTDQIGFNISSGKPPFTQARGLI